MTELKATQDPRVLGKGDLFDQYHYYGGGVPIQVDDKKR
jgi:hypothetical protein